MGHIYLLLFHHQNSSNILDGMDMQLKICWLYVTLTWGSHLPSRDGQDPCMIWEYWMMPYTNMVISSLTHQKVPLSVPCNVSVFKLISFRQDYSFYVLMFVCRKILSYGRRLPKSIWISCTIQKIIWCCKNKVADIARDTYVSNENTIQNNTFM
jgi:hypothetical protein